MAADHGSKGSRGDQACAGGLPVVAHGEDDSRAYYRTGELLRTKQQQAWFDSGRRFEQWALSLVPIVADWRILDAGCGWGRFTWSLVDEFGVPGERIVCCDRSAGMLRTAGEEARRRAQRVDMRFCDIAVLPLPSASVDLAIAGHVLYHLPDIARGVRELARVVSNRGWVLATSNSDAILPLVMDLHYCALRALGIPCVPDPPSGFSLENGRASLQGVFHRVETHPFADSITWADVASFVAGYTTIGHYQAVLADDRIPADKRERLGAEVARQAAGVLAESGSLRSETLLGAFVCREPMR